MYPTATGSMTSCADMQTAVLLFAILSQPFNPSQYVLSGHHTRSTMKTCTHAHLLPRVRGGVCNSKCSHEGFRGRTLPSTGLRLSSPRAGNNLTSLSAAAHSRDAIDGKQKASQPRRWWCRWGAILPCAARDIHRGNAGSARRDCEFVLFAFALAMSGA